MIRRIAWLVLVATSVGGRLLPAEELFPDEKLRGVIQAILKQKQINKPSIEEADLKTIYFLEARGQDISSLQGLEKCINLASVDLSHNRITDLTPLAELKNIQTLTLSDNQIENLEPLQKLTRLQYLQLDRNRISSLQGLSELENLRALYLAENQIEALSPLEKLTKLRSLHLDGNRIQDLQPLARLQWLSSLGLRRNQVRDLSPLAGLTELHYTFLEGNPLEDLSVLVEMARKDAEGEQRFAPYWFVYLDADRLPEDRRPQLEQLQKFGVRINQR